jgi:hypothetical protein
MALSYDTVCTTLGTYAVMAPLLAAMVAGRRLQSVSPA